MGKIEMYDPVGLPRERREPPPWPGLRGRRIILVNNSHSGDAPFWSFFGEELRAHLEPGQLLRLDKREVAVPESGERLRELASQADVAIVGTAM